MSLNKLVGGDCGGNNPLVQLSNIVNRDGGSSQPISQADRFVNEFVAQNSQIAQTFNMQDLLNSMPDGGKGAMAQAQQMMNQVPQIPGQLQNSWNFAGPSSHMSMMPLMPMAQAFTAPQQPFISNRNPGVQIQYISESDLQTVTNDDVRAKAQEYVNEVKNDDELAYNQFMSFMKKVSAGEMNLGETSDSKLSKDAVIDELAEKYKDEWAKLSDVNDYWNTEAANGISEEYSFTEGNVMLENKSALEIGKEKLKMGDIPGAVLCFEAAAQQQPDSAEPWFLLGTTQAENEQDPLAITALKKSLSIDPRQLEAYMTLSAAYTNENMPKFAFNSLIEWLRASPKYSDILPQDIDTKVMSVKDLEIYIKSLFIKAAQLNPVEIDPDVQTALGVVFNITQEYDKAADCFKTALMVNNLNAKLWNRLGATLANSEKSEQAVDAYHEALSLEPGFIRARYNIGITCMNLNAYKQAAEHFLVALNQQHKAKSLFPDTPSVDVSSSTIWTTLRMVCAFMGEHAVAKLVDDRNLSELNNFFDIET